MSPDLYQYRPPIDLNNQRLRAMAAALGPAYVRISGTWANTTYFTDMDTPPTDPPQGYGGALTRQQWLAAIAFSRAVDAPIVTSVPIGEGPRGADATDTTYSRSVGNSTPSGGRSSRFADRMQTHLDHI